MYHLWFLPNSGLLLKTLPHTLTHTFAWAVDVAYNEEVHFFVGVTEKSSCVFILEKYFIILG